MIQISLSKKVTPISGEQFITDSNRDLEVNIKFIVQEIIRSLNNTEWYEKVFFKERNGVKLYILVPEKYQYNIDSVENNILELSFSLIFGQIILNDGTDNIFYNNPKTIFEIIEEFAVLDFEQDEWDTQSYETFIYFIENIYMKSGMIDYFHNILSIKNEFHCPHCDIYMDQTSYEDIVQSNFETDFNNDLTTICCPICGNSIYLTHEISEMIHSFRVASLYKNFFYRDIYSESFKLQYFNHINKKYPDSELLKNGYYESLDDLTYRDLFGVTKHKFLEVWNVFSGGLFEKMRTYRKFKYLEIKDDDGFKKLYPNARYQENYDFLVENASRLIREKKLKNLFNES